MAAWSGAGAVRRGALKIGNSACAHTSELANPVKYLPIRESLDDPNAMETGQIALAAEK